MTPSPKKRENLVKKLKQIMLNNYFFALNMHSIKRAFRLNNPDFKLSKSDINTLNRELRINNGKINVTLLGAMEEAYNDGTKDIWQSLGNEYSKEVETAKAFKEIKEKSIKRHRDGATYARQEFNKTRSGRSLSERVWRLNKNVSIEVEALTQNAIKEGVPADELARKLRRYLNEPDRIYRKVRNPKTGRLEWSKAAKEYNPGRGVYRSSVKNAERLARTEINRAYRLAEWQSYQDNPLIKGYMIRTSNNRESVCPVCTQLEGVYPKWFMWSGWHPQCRCVMIPVQLTPKEFGEYIKDKENYQGNYAKEMPANFVKFMKDNKDKFQAAKSLPYWYLDNINKLKEL